MKIFCALLLITYLVEPSRTNSIDIPCTSCKDNVATPLEGTVGGNVTLTLTITFKTFMTLKIFYNNTEITATNAGVVIQNKGNRIKHVDKFNVDGDVGSLSLTLIGLTLKDNVLKFTIKYTDAPTAKDIVVSAGVTVQDPRTDQQKSGAGSSSTIIIIVVVVLIVLIAAILVLLYKRGIIFENGCSRHSKGTRLATDDHEKQLGGANDINTIIPKYDPSQTSHSQTEYAELGPGGRINVPDSKPEKSLYAEVKTENVHYPDPTYEDPQHVIV